MSDETQKPAFGEPHVNFAQALVQLARDHGVASFEGSFRLGWDWRDAATKWQDGSVRVVWMEGRHSDASSISLTTSSTATICEIAPDGAKVPALVYAFEGNFYEASTRRGKGLEFYDRWRHRIAEFPASREDALEAAGPDTRAYIERRFPT